MFDDDPKFDAEQCHIIQTTQSVDTPFGERMLVRQGYGAVTLSRTQAQILLPLIVEFLGAEGPGDAVLG